MNRKLNGKVAWISGGASGMGAAIGELFARHGAKVMLADVQADRGHQATRRINEACAEAGQDVAGFTLCDVTSEADVKQSIDQTADTFGGLHIVANCAGIVHVKKLHEYDEADWDRLMAVNLKSIFLAVKHAHRHLTRHKRSYVVNIGSVGSFIGQLATPAYTASKGGVLQLSRSIALDYAADGLRCNCICPGITDTPMLREHLNATPDPEATLAQRLRRVPMGIALTPHDIAKAALYFACEDSAGITGTSLVVDAGYIAAAEWETAGPTAFTEAP